VSVVAREWIGANAVRLTYRTADNKLDERILYRDHEPRLSIAKHAAAYDFGADGQTFKLAAEALRIRMAGRFDPMLAVQTSNLDALPHQIQAVYGELLDRTPLRFLLADDPGAGKTIMAGLYIKELMLRGDLERCLIVAPGGLVDHLSCLPVSWPTTSRTRKALKGPCSPNTPSSSRGWISSQDPTSSRLSSSTRTRTWSSSTRRTACPPTTSAPS
jgi:hypothetical protein